MSELSLEEKKAIERIEDVFYQDLGKGINKFQKITLYADSITDIRKLLNLINKQQKEIEELKEKSMHITKETVEFVNSHYIHNDKIKAKVIEIKDRPVKDEFITASQGKLNTIIEIESLLEKE